MTIKYGDCIRCGWCCIEVPCGAGRCDPCEHLSSDADGVHTCSQYPFDHLDAFSRICLEPGKGCGGGGENPLYEKLWCKMKRIKYQRLYK